MSADLRLGDCLDVLRTLPDESVHAVVCDPPAGIGFMGKAWDGDKGGRDAWVAWLSEVMGECLRVVKPGGHALVWALPRTSHWTGWALEGAGWEIRDRIGHFFATGFPKSMSVDRAIDAHLGKLDEREVAGARRVAADKWTEPGRQAIAAGISSYSIPTSAPATPEAAAWSGYGTALKPAIEDWWLCRAPLSEKSIAANVLAHGTGALNVDACRYAYGDTAWPGPNDGPALGWDKPRGGIWKTDGEAEGQLVANPLGRWPANVIAIPKSSRAERERGCEGLEPMAGHEAVERTEGSAGLDNPRAGAGRTATEVRNGHPTVKPVHLMRWLCRLVTPPGGTILDPFMGSGTTGCAALLEGFDFIGIEREPDYMKIARARIEHAAREVGGGDTLDLFRQAPEVSTT